MYIWLCSVSVGYANIDTTDVFLEAYIHILFTFQKASTLPYSGWLRLFGIVFVECIVMLLKCANLQKHLITSWTFPFLFVMFPVDMTRQTSTGLKLFRTLTAFVVALVECFMHFVHMVRQIPLVSKDFLANIALKHRFIFVNLFVFSK